MSEPHFKIDFQVRDYECDLQGVVNNSTYQNYLEHARHELLREIGLDFDKLNQENVFMTLVKAELNYKYPLRSGDRFYVTVNVEYGSRIKVLFNQEIRLYPDDKLVMAATMTGVALNERHRPFRSAELARVLNEKLGISSPE